jgi:gamma-glutamyltranspeptidase / glutathione hydrolase
MTHRPVHGDGTVPPRTPWRRIGETFPWPSVLILAGLISLSLHGCGATPPASTPDPGPTTAPAPAGAEGELTAPTPHTHGSAGSRAVGSEAMVASAHPRATQAGVQILEAGGNAIDAAVATAFAVGVVEPMMAGIGGSGGMLLWLESEERAEYLDFYAVAPANPDTTFPHYDGPNHTPRGVAVPGTVAGLLEALESHGTMDRGQVLSHAIALAQDGFPVSPLLARTIAGDSTKLVQYRRSQEIFWPGYRPLRAGERLVQPELAESLRAIAREGRAGFHEGPVAQEIVQVLNEGGNPMTLEDLASFTPRWRRPVCGVYRGRTVLSAPPPQSGMQIVQTLNLLESQSLGESGPPFASSTDLHTLATAIRTAAGDRRSFLGDPDQVGVPARGLISRGFAAERASQVGRGASPIPHAVPEADPWAFEDEEPPEACRALNPFGSAPARLRPEPPHSEQASTPSSLGTAEVSSDGGQGGHSDRDHGETTHISVVDAEGNAVSLTFTQGVYFGTGAWAAGTFLNSGLFIFSTEGPNRIAPGKAPASTTTPTILLGRDGVEMVVGSPGGGRIPPAVIQTIVFILDYGVDPATALTFPRINPHFTAPNLDFEQGISGEVLAGLRGHGWEPLVFAPMSLHFGGVQLLWNDGQQWIGAADPRRDGAAAGY